MLLGGLFRGLGIGDGPMATLSPAKAAHNLHDMHRWADCFGVPFQMPASHPMRTVRALRVLLALPHARWPAAIAAIFAAYWQRGEDITRDDVLADALRAADVPADDVGAALARADEPEIKDELRRRTDEALELGIFGAPAWIFRRDGGRAPLLVWGQDRMPWIEAILAGWNPDAEPPPAGPRTLEVPRAAPGAAVDVFYDASSPFAYLALTQLPALAASGAALRLVPILLGALFRELGQANVPLLSWAPAKTRYVTAEMSRWARWWGEPLEMPRKFPQRTITAQRLAILAADAGIDPGIRLARALGRAMWAEQRDLEDAATLRAILAAEGLPEGWVERTQEPELKARLAANTAEAARRGVFGVPTFIVSGVRSSASGVSGPPPEGVSGVPGGAGGGGSGEHLFWGQDRLDLVGLALSGTWTPP